MLITPASISSLFPRMLWVSSISNSSWRRVSWVMAMMGLLYLRAQNARKAQPSSTNLFGCLLFLVGRWCKGFALTPNTAAFQLLRRVPKNVVAVIPPNRCARCASTCTMWPNEIVRGSLFGGLCCPGHVCVLCGSPFISFDLFAIFCIATQSSNLDDFDTPKVVRFRAYGWRSNFFLFPAMKACGL